LAADAAASCRDASQNGDSGQQAQYCKAAEIAKAGARDAKILWKIWAATAAVCSYACYQTIAGNPLNSLVCAGANTAAGVTDAVMTKNFSSALMAIGTAGVSYVTTRNATDQLKREATARAEAATLATGKTVVAEKTKNAKDLGSCMAAATAGMQALGKNKAAGQNQQVYESSMASAEREISSATQNSPNADARPKTGTGGSGASGAGSPLAPIGANPESSSSVCAQAAGEGYQGVVACAMASDSNLPSFVNSPKLSDDFKRATGQDLADFVKSEDANAASTLSDMMGGGLNSAASGKLAEVIAQLDQALRTDPGVEGTSYAQGGGSGRAPASNEQEPDLSGLMKSMFGGLMPTDGSGKARPGVATVIFANQRNPASLFEDRTISLFDRVTYRYGLLGRGMMP